MQESLNLFKDEIKNISIKMTILFTVYLYLAVVFFSEKGD
jgi:hypothetical protein